MAWFRVEGKVAFHRKMVKAGNSAVGAWVRMGAWCADNRTNGRIPRAMAEAIGNSNGNTNDIRMLLLCGLVSEEDGDIVLHDFLVYNISAEKDAERRAKKAKAGRLGARVRWGASAAHDTSNSNRHGSRLGKRNGKTIADPDPDLPLQQQQQQQEQPAHTVSQETQPPASDYVDPRVHELAAALRSYHKLAAVVGDPERYVEAHVLVLLDQHPRFTAAHALLAFKEADHDTPDGEPPAFTLKRLRSYLSGKVQRAEADAHRGDPAPASPQQRILPESHRHLKPPPPVPPPMIPLPPPDPNMTLEEMREKLSNRMGNLFGSKPEPTVRKAAPPDGDATPTLPFPDANDAQSPDDDEALTATEA